MWVPINKTSTSYMALDILFILQLKIFTLLFYFLDGEVNKEKSINTECLSYFSAINNHLSHRILDSFLRRYKKN